MRAGPELALATTRVERVTEQACFTREAAARYLGFESARSLEERADIPYVDLRKPGAKQPMIRYLKADLDRLLAERRVDPVAERRAVEQDRPARRREAVKAVHHPIMTLLSTDDTADRNVRDDSDA